MENATEQLENKNRKIPDVIKFIRQKDYKFIKELGHGSFGITVLLEDEIINEKFVCKKYSPQFGVNKEKYFKNFINEIKLLHLLYHDNIVRVFNYYIYDEECTGFILMEHVEGFDIISYLQDYPEMVNDVFEQTINGFAYLESKNILHRDIRSSNILVNNGGFVKIIDFGLGKQAVQDKDFDKSISLNWWCDLPSDFEHRIYNFKTEIYFVGKLFEKIISENNIENFNYINLLKKMCSYEIDNRIDSFDIIQRDIQKNEITDDLFDYLERQIYKSFSNKLHGSISQIYSDAKYYNDIELIQKNLETLYKNVMLEDEIPQNAKLINYFVNGGYTYWSNVPFETSTLKDFINLLKSCSKDKKNIIINNIHSKLDSIKRTKKDIIIDDDEIPF